MEWKDSGALSWPIGFENDHARSSTREPIDTASIINIDRRQHGFDSWRELLGMESRPNTQAEASRAGGWHTRTRLGS